VQFSAAVYSVDEGAGSATITIVLSAPAARRVSVEVNRAGGTADPGKDYGKIVNTLNLNQGTTRQTFTIQIVDDAIDEEDETVVLALRNPTNAVLGAPAEATLAIIDNDTTPPPAAPNVRLNEILSVPGQSDWDEDGEANELDQWIELYNAGPEPVDLGGWLLGGARNSRAPYPIPAGTLIEPDAFLVLYRQETGIVLNRDGGAVRLLDPAKTLVDVAMYAKMEAGESYNRADSENWYVASPPSPGLPNTVLTP
jgi:hypothetical protein